MIMIIFYSCFRKFYPIFFYGQLIYFVSALFFAGFYNFFLLSSCTYHTDPCLLLDLDRAGRSSRRAYDYAVLK